MVNLGALLMVVGTGCHLVNPKGIWSNGIWLTAIFTATFAVLAESKNCKVLRMITVISAAVTILCIMFGFISLIKEVQDWPE